ncbi:glycosyltransferase family 2 protein [Mycetocola zhadangensis]|uniref:glycosyltransferase family 2 protein n=1 Tax=Mycetocola zhadangensis TaxID=1164595 RepID=UPI003A4E50A1
MQRPPAPTLIVMPAFNEAEAIGSVIAEVRASVQNAHVLVIDDGSSDETARVAALAGADVAQLPFNLGVGGAMRLGFRYAIRNGYANVVQLDSDGQHDPSYVKELVNGLDRSDIVIGARFAGEGNYAVKGPRRWAMSLLSFVISRIAHTRLTDTTSGFKACGPRAVQLFAAQYPAEYLGDTIEALVIAARAGCIIEQHPVAMRERQGGIPSHNPWKSAVYLGRAFFALSVALVRPASSFRLAMGNAR